MRKRILALSLLLLTGCTSLKSQAGAIPNAELYVHRKPIVKEVSQVVTTDKGVITQVIPWGEISKNAPAIGNSVANIVGAVKGNFGFPFAIVPELVNSGLAGASNLKEETQNQEVYKLNWVSGIHDLEANLPDGTILKINLDKSSAKQKQNEDIK